MNLFKVLCSEGRMNISALARKAGCTSRRIIVLLGMLKSMGVVEEKSSGGIRTFQIKDGGLTELLKRATEMIDSRDIRMEAEVV